jgi:hypothetical protein
MQMLERMVCGLSLALALACGRTAQGPVKNAGAAADPDHTVVKTPSRAAAGPAPVSTTAVATPAQLAASARHAIAGDRRFLGVWVEPGAIALVAKDPSRATLEKVTRDSVRAMHEIGATTIILAYPEQSGVFYYPSAIEFHDRDLKRIVKGADCPFDVYGTVLDEADRLGLHVFLGLGRSGDTPLLWEFDKPGWAERNQRASEIARRVAAELHQRYSRHRSFHGWYLTHEMDDLAKASAYYDPVADGCHKLSPEKPVLAAPAGTPIITTELLARSKVDIFAYQDAVGAGYVPYKNTYNPERRLALLNDAYRRYAQWHAGTRKRIWSDLEVWEMDGTQGYTGAFAASFARVKRQIELEAPHVEMLTLYAWHGYMQDPKSTAEKPNPKARALFTAYREWLDKISSCQRAGGSIRYSSTWNDSRQSNPLRCPGSG